MHQKKEKSGFVKTKPSDAMSLSPWKIHKDWRTWVAVILMLLAMFVYVLTLDDAVQPTGPSSKAIWDIHDFTILT